MKNANFQPLESLPAMFTIFSFSAKGNNFAVGFPFPVLVSGIS